MEVIEKNIKTSRAQRRATPKSKLGCFTCRARRIKCDETKPTCNRCRIGKQWCGYVSQFQRSSGAYASPKPRKNKRVPGEVVFSIKESAELQHLIKPILPSTHGQCEPGKFDCFRRAVAELLPMSLEPKFWARVVVPLAYSENSLRQAIIAVARIYRCQTLIGPEKLQEQETSQMEYIASLGMLKKKLDKSTASRDLAVCGSLLYATYDLFYGNHTRAARHLEGSFAIMAEILVNSKDMSETTKYFMSVLCRIDKIASTWPVSGYTPKALRRPVVSSQFHSNTEAYQILCDIITDMYRFKKLECEGKSTLPYSPVPPEIARKISQINHNIEKWITVFKKSELRQRPIKGSMQGSGSASTIGTYVLIAQYLAARIQASMLCYRDEISFDWFSQSFAEIVEKAGPVIDSIGEDCSKYSAGIVQPLWFVATKCRDLSLRIQAVGLMARVGGRAMVSGKFLVGAASWVVQQEHGISSQFVPEERRLRHLDVVPDRARGRIEVFGTRRLPNGEMERVSGIVGDSTVQSSRGDKNRDKAEDWKDFWKKPKIRK